MANIKFSAFTQKVVTGNVDFLVGYTGADNVRISPAIFSDTYLPLAGGTMTGSIIGTSATFNSGVTIDGIYIDGTEIDLSSGTLTFDADAYSFLDGDATFAGNVGIGAAASDGNFQVKKAGVDTGITNVLINASFSEAAGSVSGLSIGYRTDETTAVIAPRTATGNLAFYNYDAGWSESMRITNTGHVGIAVDNPEARLQVNEIPQAGGSTTTAPSLAHFVGSTAPSTVNGFATLKLEYPAGATPGDAGAQIMFTQGYHSGDPDNTQPVGSLRGYRTGADTQYGGGLQLTYQPDALPLGLVPGITLDGDGTVTIGTGTVAAANAAADDFVITGPGTTATGMTISNTSDSGVGTIFFGDTTSSAAAGFRYDHNTGDMSVSAEDDINFTCDNASFAGNVIIHDSSNAPYIDFVESGATTDSKARITMDQVDTDNGTLIFSTEGSGNLTERMRITNTGLTKINSSTSGNHEAYQKTGTYTKTSTGSTTAMDIVKVGHTHAVNYTVTAKIDTSNQGVLVGNTATAYGGNGGMQVDSEAYAGVISDIAVAYDNSFYGFTVAVTYTGASHPIIYMAVTGQSSEDFVQQ